jgi:hypothetical protein
MPSETRTSGKRPRFIDPLFRILFSAVLLTSLWGMGAARGAGLPPDSLTKLQKSTINRLAESKLGEYMSLLNGLAFLSGSDEASMEAEEYIERAVTGDGRIFQSVHTIIESNVDPELPTDALSRNRKAREYLNDFKLLFRSNGPDAVEHSIVMRAEPHARGGIIYTRVLYDVKLNGRHESRPGATYSRQRRVAEMIAEDKGGGNWLVTIAGDGFFTTDPKKPFEQFSVDRDLEAVRKGALAETAELARLRKEEEDAKKKAAEAEAQKKKAYQDAIEQGDKLLDEGDPDLALDMYDQAGRIDPLSTTHLIRKKKGVRAYEAKVRDEISRALDALAADLSRQVDAKGFRSVTVMDFTEADGRQSPMGTYLTDHVAIRMAGGKHRFKMLPKERSAKAKAAVRGQMVRTGKKNDRVNLTATLMDLKRSNMEGGAQQEFPMPQGFSPLTATEAKAEPTPAEPVKKEGDGSVSPPMKKAEAGHWSIALSAGINVTRVTDTDPLTEAFTVGNQGVRLGAELEHISSKGSSRFTTGVRLSQLKCSTAEEDLTRVIDVVYLQLPVLYKLFANETAIGRFGVQVGGLLDCVLDSKTESNVPGQYIEMSDMNAHASPGLCYEVPGPGGSHIVANASYDLMLFKLSELGAKTKNGPRLHGLSFAIGVRF